VAPWNDYRQFTRRSEPRSIFYGLFYGRAKFCCKTAQFSVTLCELLTTETPSVSVAVQRRENARKNSVLNYESPALTAELQARVAHTVKHSTSQMTNPESVRGCSNR
jgi:hypothetical protein